MQAGGTNTTNCIAPGTKEKSEVLTVEMIAKPLGAIIFHLLTSPLQVMKTRRQTLPAMKMMTLAGEPLRDGYLFDCNKQMTSHFRNIIRTQGFLGLYKGWTSLALYSVLTWGLIPLYETESVSLKAMATMSSLFAFNILLVHRTWKVVECGFATKNYYRMARFAKQKKALPYRSSWLIGMTALIFYNVGGIPYTSILVNSIPEQDKDKDNEGSRKIRAGLAVTAFFASFPLLYPFNTIAANQQVLALCGNTSVRTVATLLYKDNGWRAFYRGFGVYMATSFPITLPIGLFLGAIFLKEEKQ